MADLGLAHTVLWGSDYPHYDCTYPGALGELDKTLNHLARDGLGAQVLDVNPRRWLNIRG